MSGDHADGALHARDALPADVPDILRNIRGLALAEGRPDAAVITERRLDELLFGRGPGRPGPTAHCLIFSLQPSPRPVGHAWMDVRYPTFTGRPLLHLEDLYIDPAHRGRGIGRRAMAHVAAFAHALGCARLEWSVLVDNARAIRFYEQLGAQRCDHAYHYELAGDALVALAGSAVKGP